MWLKIHKVKNKNARRLKEVHIAQNLKKIKIVNRAGEDLKDLDQHLRFCDELKEMKKLQRTWNDWTKQKKLFKYRNWTDVSQNDWQNK